MMKGRQVYFISALTSPPLHFEVSQCSSLLEYNYYITIHGHQTPTPVVFPLANMHV